MKTQQEKLINKLIEYEYYPIKVLNSLDKETHKIEFDCKKEFNHIKKIIERVYFNDVINFNKLSFSYDEKFIYLNLEVLKE